MLVRQEQPNKATPPYKEEPLKLVYRKGSQVVGKRADGSTVTRTTAHFKPIPYHFPELCGVIPCVQFYKTILWPIRICIILGLFSKFSKEAKKI